MTKNKNTPAKKFLETTESDVQWWAQRAMRRKLSPAESKFLKERTIRDIHSLLIKIGSSGIRGISQGDIAIGLQTSLKMAYKP